jgi:ribosomal protein S18 acetylase RimI-like enzyme
MTEFANALAAEHQSDPNFGVLLSKRVTRDEEAEWLAKLLVKIEQGRAVSVVAEVDGKVVGNSEVVRGSLDDESTHGKLGIAIARDYRGIGIGNAMMRSLTKLSKEAGLKTLELEVLSTNPRAAILYERLGFKRTGLLKGKIRRGQKVIDAIIMTRDL